jgi:hypothetical protein
MNPSHSLESFRSQINSRLLRVRRIYHSSRTTSSTLYSNNLLAVSAVELDNLIVSGFRCFLISCLSCAKRASGGKVSTSFRFRSEGEIGAFILRAVNSVKYTRLNSPNSIQKSEEPTVRFPREVRAVLMQANSSNISAFDQAMSINSSVFDALCTVRNFYAHRNKDTWKKVVSKTQGQGYFIIRSPGDFLHAPVRGLSTSVMEDWLDDITIFFDHAVQ